MNKRDKQQWSAIGHISWELAKEAHEHEKKTGGNAADYIWEHVHDYGLNEYECGIMGEWACNNLDKIAEEGT